METCLWKGKKIVAYDPKNQYGEWDYPLKEAYIEAGQGRDLRCEECGAPVFYRPGAQKEPHFAHYSDPNRCCLLERSGESQEHLASKRVLYHYFRSMYPVASVCVNHRHPFQRRSDIFLQFESGERLAIEYQRSDVRVMDWKQKQADYAAHGIASLWVLSSSTYYRPSVDPKIFADVVSHRSVDETLIMLSLSEREFILSKLIEVVDESGSCMMSKRVYAKYPMEAVWIGLDGTIHCKDFAELIRREQELLREEARQSANKPTKAPASSWPRFPAPEARLQRDKVEHRRSSIWSLETDVEMTSIITKLFEDQRIDEANELKCLMDPDCLKMRKQIWASERESSALWIRAVEILKLKEVPPYLSQEISGALVFRCDKTLWQAVVLSAIVSGETTAKHVAGLSKWVRNKSTIPLHRAISDFPVKGLLTVGDVLFQFLCGLQMAGLVVLTNNANPSFASFELKQSSTPR